MAIWQYRLILLPEKVLLGKFDVLPLAIPIELVDEFSWSGEVQPEVGVESQIDMMLPPMDSWSTSMRMWGQEEGNDAHVLYVDDSRKTVEEISFRIDARAVSHELVHQICGLAKRLGCVLLTSEYEILVPDESMVLTAINQSTAKKFVNDPVSTLQNLDYAKLQQQAEYFLKDFDKSREKGKL